MSDRVLPETIRPAKLARHGATLDGVVPLERFERLGADLSGAQGQGARVTATFSPASDGRVLVDGAVSAAVPFQCQRCLEPVVCELASTLKVALVPAGEADEGLPEEYEPLEADPEEMLLADLIEQELILAAPIVPQHDECEPLVMPEPVEAPVAEVQETRPNPFRELAALLGSGKPPES